MAAGRRLFKYEETAPLWQQASLEVAPPCGSLLTMFILRCLSVGTHKYITVNSAHTVPEEPAHHFLLHVQAVQHPRAALLPFSNSHNENKFSVSKKES